MSNVVKFPSRAAPGTWASLSVFLPEGQEGEALSRAFDALDSVNVDHMPLGPGEDSKPRRKALMGFLDDACSAIGAGRIDDAQHRLLEVLAYLKTQADMEDSQ